MSSTPFKHDTETTEKALEEHLKVSAELRQIRELIAQKDADLIALRTAIAQVQSDALRAVSASTLASANSERVLRAFEELKPYLAKLVGNGHA